MKVARLVVASKNPDKIAEVEAVLTELDLVGEIVRGLDWPDIDETESSLEGNAILKARAVAGATGLAALADDTGLEVEALGGAPGVHTARFAGPAATYAENVDRLLDVMTNETNRRARFRTAVALVANGAEVVAEGFVEGEITRTRRGEGGFGYDPIFAVAGRTFGEMGDEKHGISHRGRALRSLAAKVAQLEA